MFLDWGDGWKSGRSPHGERGLKYDYQQQTTMEESVALLMESVD